MIAKLSSEYVESLTAHARPYEVWDKGLKNFVLRVQPSGIKTYYCVFKTSEGRRSRIRIGVSATISATDARDEARKYLGDVVRGKDPIREKRVKRASTLQAFVENSYAPWVRAHRRSPEMTLDRLRLCFSHLFTKRMEEISPWLVEKWRSERRRAGISPATINRDLVTLRAVLSKAVDWEILPRHPLRTVKQFKVDNRTMKRFLSFDEESRLRSALTSREAKIRTARRSANEWRRERGYELLLDFPETEYVDHVTPIVLLAINSGMRRGEIFKLTWNRVSFERRSVTVAGETSKSGVGRTIPMNRELLAVLTAWHLQCGSPRQGLVFPSSSGERLTDFTSAWRNVLKAADIENFRFHDTRHHFASKLVQSGVSLAIVRELLGHSDISQTLVYAHHAPGEKENAVELLSKNIATPGLTLSEEVTRLANEAG